MEMEEWNKIYRPSIQMRDAGIIMFIESTRFKKWGPPLGRTVFGEPQFVHFFAEISVRIFN